MFSVSGSSVFWGFGVQGSCLEVRVSMWGFGSTDADFGDNLRGRVDKWRADTRDLERSSLKLKP